MQETNAESEAKGRKEKLRNGKNDGRSFKEMVVGTSQHLKVIDRLKVNQNLEVGLDNENYGRELEKKSIKGLIWKLVEKVLNSANIEEIKQKFGVVIEEVINAIRGRQDAMDVLVDWRKGGEKMLMESGDEQQGAFYILKGTSNFSKHAIWESLIYSMLPRCWLLLRVYAMAIGSTLSFLPLFSSTSSPPFF